MVSTASEKHTERTDTARRIQRIQRIPRGSSLRRLMLSWMSHSYKQVHFHLIGWSSCTMLHWTLRTCCTDCSHSGWNTGYRKPTLNETKEIQHLAAGGAIRSISQIAPTLCFVLIPEWLHFQEKVPCAHVHPIAPWSLFNVFVGAHSNPVNRRSAVCLFGFWSEGCQKGVGRLSRTQAGLPAVASDRNAIARIEVNSTSAQCS